VRCHNFQEPVDVHLLQRCNDRLIAIRRLLQHTMVRLRKPSHIAMPAIAADAPIIGGGRGACAVKSNVGLTPLPRSAAQ
jgi:hypothetical protein